MNKTQLMCHKSKRILNVCNVRKLKLPAQKMTVIFFDNRCIYQKPFDQNYFPRKLDGNPIKLIFLFELENGKRRWRIELVGGGRARRIGVWANINYTIFLNLTEVRLFKKHSNTKTKKITFVMHNSVSILIIFIIIEII